MKDELWVESKPLPNGWRIGAMSEAKISEHLKYVARVAKELEAIPRIKREVPTTWQGKPIEELSQEEREAFHFSLQPQSTQDALTRQKTRKPSEDIDYLLRPMPECIANPEAKSLDELTAKRTLGLEETLLVEDLRRKGRNTLGQSTASSVDEEKKTKGIEAFTYSQPAAPSERDLKHLTKLIQTGAVMAEERSSQATPRKRPWWKFWQKREEWNLYDSTTWRNDDSH